MINLIIVIILVAVLGSAGLYIYKEKKNGSKCAGCPCAKGCTGCKGNLNKQ